MKKTEKYPFVFDYRVHTIAPIEDIAGDLHGEALELVRTDP